MAKHDWVRAEKVTSGLRILEVSDGAELAGAPRDALQQLVNATYNTHPQFLVRFLEEYLYADVTPMSTEEIRRESSSADKAPAQAAQDDEDMECGICGGDDIIDRGLKSGEKNFCKCLKKGPMHTGKCALPQDPTNLLDDIGLSNAVRSRFSSLRHRQPESEFIAEIVSETLTRAEKIVVDANASTRAPSSADSEYSDVDEDHSAGRDDNYRMDVSEDVRMSKVREGPPPFSRHEPFAGHHHAMKVFLDERMEHYARIFQRGAWAWGDLDLKKKT